MIHQLLAQQAEPNVWQDILNIILGIFNTKIPLGESEVSITTLVLLLLLLIPAYFLSRLFQQFLEKFILGRVPNLSQANQFLILKISHYIIMVLAVLVILSTIGVNLNSLTVIFGLLGVGIGFGLQNLAANFISGLIILVEQPIKVGDWVEINNREGAVTDINLRSTHIETNDAVHIIVPNRQILENNIVNNSQGKPYFRVRTPVGVSYGSDMKLVHETLLDVARENSRTLSMPEPEVWLVGFGDSSVDFHVMTWITSPKERERLMSEIYMSAWWALKQKGIEIPFPQRDLHIRSSDVEFAPAKGEA